MTAIFFSNTQNLLDYKFSEMIDKWIECQSKTDDCYLRNEIKYILGRDYYKDALKWLQTFRDAEWWKEDLT